LQAHNAGVSREEQLLFAGVDLVLEVTEKGELVVWVLEVNARPGGLMHAVDVVFQQALVPSLAGTGEQERVMAGQSVVAGQTLWPHGMGFGAAMAGEPVVAGPMVIEASGGLLAPVFWSQGAEFGAAMAGGLEESLEAVAADLKETFFAYPTHASDSVYML